MAMITLTDEAAKDDVLIPRKGDFIATARYFKGRYVQGQPLAYDVVKTLTADEFYAIIGKPVPGQVTAEELSDDLVAAFDTGRLADGNGNYCLFVWREVDGKLVSQHST